MYIIEREEVKGFKITYSATHKLDSTVTFSVLVFLWFELFNISGCQAIFVWIKVSLVLVEYMFLNLKLRIIPIIIIGIIQILQLFYAKFELFSE